MDNLKGTNFKSSILLLVSVFFVLASASAQQTTITGLVTDDQGQPVPGASVVVKGTSTGVSTDFDGLYSIEASPSDILVFSIIGFTKAEVPIGNRTKIDVSLDEDVSQLDEVVVTALGIKTEKRALGFSTAQVDGDEISAVKATNNFVNALSGKVAGLQISSTSSQPGSGTRIVLRGGSSITGQNQPLIVLNGIPFDADNSGGSSGLADIDPNSISNISVLKGAAASALYGSEAAHGVILITTKSGTFDSKPVVTISNSSSFDQIYEIPTQKTWSQGFWDGNNWKYVDGETSFTSTSWGPRISDVPGAKLYDRWDVFKTGFTNETNASITGGGSKATYYVSYGNLRNSGIVDPLSYNRNTINANTTFRFSPKLTVSSSIMYSIQNVQQMAESSSNSAFMNTVMATPNTWNPYPVRDENGKLRSYRGGSRNPYLWVMDNSRENTTRDRFNGTFTLEYEITPKLKFRSVTGFNTISNNFNDHLNKGGYADVNGTYSSKESFSRDIESTETITYDNKFGDFSVNALVGHNIVENKWRYSEFTGNGLVIPGIYNTSNVSSYEAGDYNGVYRAYSFFGQARVGYKNMLYYTITGRNDWASSVENSFFYPSHSLGFVFSELIPDSNIFNFGKLRASYAKVGAPADAYSRNVNLVDAGGNGVTWPFNGRRSYLSSDKAPNPALVNEFKSEVEFGAELQFFNNRLGLDFAYYHNWSDNQILTEQFLSSTGYTYGDVNIGGITHKGVELGVTGTPVKTNNFSWDIILNYSKDNSNVDKLGTNDEPIDLGSFGYAVVGQPYPVIYGTGFLRDDQNRMVLDDTPGGAGFARPLADNNQNLVLGRTSPDWIGSLRNSFNYKNFTLTAQLDISVGGSIYSETDHYLTWYGLAEHQENRPENNQITFDGVLGHYDFGTKQVVVTNETPQPTSYSLYWQNVAQNMLEDNIMPRDYIKLREVQLLYRLPEKFTQKMNLKGLEFSLSGRNLWRKFNKDYYGPDPEINSDGITNGNAYLSYSFPATKTYSLTITAKL